MAPKTKLAIGAAVCAVAGGVFIHGDFGARAIEAELKSAVESRLRAKEFDWAQISVDGQRVTLSGSAPDRKILEEAIVSASTAHGPGGLALGAITGVDASGVKIAPALRPRDEFSLRVIKRSQAVSAFGDTTGEGITAAFEAAFPGTGKQVAATLQPDAFEDASSWEAFIAPALLALSRLEGGELRVSGRRLEIEGRTLDAAAAQEADAYLEAADAQFDIVAEYFPDDAAALLSPVECEGAAKASLAANPLVFEHEQSRLAGSAAPAIDRLAEALKQCDAALVEIAGHTDDRGSASSNVGLSERRAKALADALVERGVPHALAVAGFGETRPIADNATPEGRAANRRIELSVRPLPAESE